MEADVADDDVHDGAYQPGFEKRICFELPQAAGKFFWMLGLGGGEEDAEEAFGFKQVAREGGAHEFGGEGDEVEAIDVDRRGVHQGSTGAEGARGEVPY